MASVLGRFLDWEGSSNRLRSAKDAAGTLVTAKRRSLILRELGIGLRRWEQYTEDWERRYVAHRCSRGTVFLFAIPLLEECPACHTGMSVEHPAPASSQPGGPGRTRRDSSGQGEGILRIGRKDPSGGVERILRIPGTEPTHSTDRVLPRDRSRGRREEGLEGF